MFKDVTKFDYFTATNTPAVVLEHDKGNAVYPSVLEVVAHDKLVPLLDKLLRKRPAWRFKETTERSITNSPYIIRNLDVFDGDECLGKVYISKHWRTGEPRYCIDNFRIRDKMERGKETFTTKLDVAAKKILADFYPRNPEEQMAEAITDAHNVIPAAHGNAAWDHRRKVSGIMDDLKDYIIRNWDTMRHHVRDPKYAAYDMKAKQARLDELRTVGDVYINGSGFLIMCRPDGNYVRGKHGGSDETTTWVMTDAELPDEVRARLGMLKMLDVKEIVAGVGARVSHNTFFILR
jgi:hypothetical protein